MPGVLRQGMERMLPRMLAQQALARMMSVAVGTGSLDPKDSRKWVRDQQRAADPQARRAVRASSWDEHFERLRAAGLDVVVE